MSSEEGEQAGDKSLAAIMSSTNGEGCLKGVVAFVDVKTADGDDASPIFSDMLRALGAKVSYWILSESSLQLGLESINGQCHAYRIQIGEADDSILV